ncbi:hypothetical protein A1O3_09996 [Capronia epimyces CBS 606.96]|uniref:BHLH domain-containing protein n=1 Tax=Capronia epimyces CBS 606.96 TaxID=1182542 RepID=W9XBA4_9EURO|nr:uncharacterized protein A1O3_09996 [Capronia epimyces CBS 606.96]EXJ77767.1 hypothetical protein A1O3_09996 [Capronia epimyces CBS 606.96]
MPRPRLPPTPTCSTDLKAQEKTIQSSDMETVFALPPPALRPNEGELHPHRSKSTTRGNSISVPLSERTPPVSPTDKPLTSSPRHKRTASGAIKANTEPTNAQSKSSYELPPPPTRARKIIQMKPKTTTTTTASASSPSDTSYQPPTPAASASNSSSRSSGTATNSKRKQTSAGSAAGRKIARKTAHSIIERRRRSKMNEEFGVLKDMIPACEGVEMHKLAILQAGIEYVRYLEGCVRQLKAENEKRSKSEFEIPQMPVYEHMEEGEDEEGEEGEEEDDEDEDEDDDEELHHHDHTDKRTSEPNSSARRQKDHPPAAVVNEWCLRESRTSSIASGNSSAFSSPHMQSQTQSQKGDQARIHKCPSLAAVGEELLAASPTQPLTQSSITSATPTPTLLSPAFNAIHFSPDLSFQTSTSTSTSNNVSTSAEGRSSSLNPPSTSTSGYWTTVNQRSAPSPQMQPLPSPTASMHLPLPHPPPFQLAGSALLPRPTLPGQRDRDTHTKSPGALSDVSGTAEATAGAALMMLTNEWRAGAREQGSSNGSVSRGRNSTDRAKGMSVRDLLSP